MSDSIFTKIIHREIPATIRYEDDQFIAFDDIQPAAPVHVLVVTKQPYPTLEEIDQNNQELQAGLLKVAREVAAKMDIADNYRLIMNVGPDMQAVPHVHLHVLGGWDQTKLQSIKHSII
jgi:histidine triad (HIT) family protein